ncbi:5-methyltetrahydropteroyltriglutamate--homocysteine S-methyltransferase [Anaerosacchariphilus polymeriproducens]|uniref:5-methyltetrahydropteroyltriglutamate--homocysteine methyltransferase n=1 Tax=Anaerosacchariphilus polymeriproducens TaxID=1812858 RepID=A0A371AX87_9FIRM|nr:5-methyltetrahydropteroyltriglutamate--homocysteine S-methyltransferase [Anaerosacchariphilus polymeriproducens]RDU24151.1 5-methyltetrahydropteroyltriglutamate--homocysteine S-methyltransferase [Anaerosacchariphilus polymeriproducens]
MQTTFIGYPRIGKMRELKFAVENYWKKNITEKSLRATAQDIRMEQWKVMKNLRVSLIPSNDFSLYDGMLDLSVMLNAIPKKYKDLHLSELDTYFAMARGYQGDKGDVEALAMKKWFNTNYHYLVPELYDDTEIKLNTTKLFSEYQEAVKAGIKTRPVIIGPYTFLQLASIKGNKTREEYVNEIITAFCQLIHQCEEKGMEWIQFDEPSLVMDLDNESVHLFQRIYEKVLIEKSNLKVLLQTYFGDIRDCYKELISMPFDGIGIDFIEGRKSLSLFEQYGFPENKTLFAGVINGKNIWKCDYPKTLTLICELKKFTDDIVISTSCSLLHVPYSIKSENKLADDILEHFSFAEEKLYELQELSQLADQIDSIENINKQVCSNQKRLNEDVRKRVSLLNEDDFSRNPIRAERQILQRKKIGIPQLATTTIGSFPQIKEVKQIRKNYKKGDISLAEYEETIFSFIKDCIKIQEDIGLDILVHGEYERNDMVEFFGENLEGYAFTDFAWVQSYGTRCVKPPIIFGDIKREKPITVKYSAYADKLTKKPVKGMLTGPVTILNWSFPREDITLKEMAFQIGLAIRDEVLDLEAAGIQIIQIDEAALREKLPLRKSEWHSEYLDWAINAFRLCHSKVKAETQIHTHMCYSEFDDIIKEIDCMDADVITFEAARSKLIILDTLQATAFETEVGPGVYDIHSPRIPSVDEITKIIRKMIQKINVEKLWVNPDCGLKTRGLEEAAASLKNLVEATEIVRNELNQKDS